MLLRPSLTIRPDLSSWSYESYRRETPSFQFGVFTSLVSLWRSKKQDSELPAWGDFDPTDLRSWMGAVAIWQAGQAHPGVITRLFGSRILSDSAASSCILADLLPVTDQDEARQTEYQSVLLTKGLLGRERGRLHLADGTQKAVEILSLPFSDDNRTVSHLLSVHSFSDSAPLPQAVKRPDLPQPFLQTKNPGDHQFL